MSVRIKILIVGLLVAGYWLTGIPASTSENIRFLLYLTLGCLTGVLAVHLPGTSTRLSVHFICVLACLPLLDWRQFVIAALASKLAQELIWTRPRRKFADLVYHTATSMVAANASFSVYEGLGGTHAAERSPLLLVLAAS